MPTATETPPAVNLAGSPQNPAREPNRKRPTDGKGSIGDQAFMDSVIIVGACWVLLLFLAYSLRHHNV